MESAAEIGAVTSETLGANDVRDRGRRCAISAAERATPEHRQPCCLSMREADLADWKRKMDPDYISEDEFRDERGVVRKSSGDLFEFADVKDQPFNHVWTILESGDGEDDNWYASPGFHTVNRMGYVMTKRPWTDELRDAIYFLDDFDHKDDDHGEV